MRGTGDEGNERLGQPTDRQDQTGAAGANNRLIVQCNPLYILQHGIPI